MATSSSYATAVAAASARQLKCLNDPESMDSGDHVKRCMDCGCGIPLSLLPTTHDNVVRCKECENCYEDFEKEECCAICLSHVGESDTCKTDCGHVFHLSCMMKVRNTNCPLCRNELVHTETPQQEPASIVEQENRWQRWREGQMTEEEEQQFRELQEEADIAFTAERHGWNDDDSDEEAHIAHAEAQRGDFSHPLHAIWRMNDSGMSPEQIQVCNGLMEQSYLEGHQDGKEEHRRQHLEDMDVAVQASYERGLIEGRAIASEDVRMLREQKSILEKKIYELTEKLKKDSKEDNKSKL